MKNKLSGNHDRAQLLIPIFQDHNQKIKDLVPREYAPGTLQRYETSLKHTKESIQWKFGTSGIDVKKIDHAFFIELEFNLRSDRKCGNNAACAQLADSCM